MSGLLFSWANEICSADNEERALVVALMNDFAYVVQAIGECLQRLLGLISSDAHYQCTQSPTSHGSRWTTLELKSVYTTRRASRSPSVRSCVLADAATYTDSLPAVFWIFLTLYLHKRDQRRAQAEAVPATLVDDDDASIEKDALSQPSGEQGEWAHMSRQFQ